MKWMKRERRLGFFGCGVGCIGFAVGAGCSIVGVEKAVAVAVENVKRENHEGANNRERKRDRGNILFKLICCELRDL